MRTLVHSVSFAPGTGSGGLVCRAFLALVALLRTARMCPREQGPVFWKAGAVLGASTFMSSPFYCWPTKYSFPSDSVFGTDGRLGTA